MQSGQSGKDDDLANEDGENRWGATVQSEDLGRRVQVLGRLGRRLGTMVTVRGRCVDSESDFDANPSFSIEELDGVQMRSTVRFPGMLVDPESPEGQKPKFEVGDAWELRGFETCELAGVPPAVFAERGQPIPRQPFGFAFITKFVYTRGQKIELRP